MNISLNQNWVKNLIKILVLLLAVICCIELFPRRNTKFSYYFEVGKPWGYGLLTAEKDFPIYKSDDRLAEDQRAALHGYYPYFSVKSDLGKKQKDEILHLENVDRLNKQSKRSLEEKLDNIYSNGLISSADLDWLMADKYEKIVIINEKKVAQTIPLKQVYTPKTAYSYLLDDISSSRQENKLRDLNLNQYLIPSLTYDTLNSNRTKQRLLEAVSLTEGMVQTGEKIIDRGEIVDEHTYSILVSMKKAYEQEQEEQTQIISSIVGTIALLVIFWGLLVIYLLTFRKPLFGRLRSFLFLAIQIFLIVAISALLVKYTSLSIFIVPFAWVSILVRVFYDSRTAFQAHLITILIVSLIVPIPYEFLVIQIVVGLVVVMSLKDIMQRSQLVQTSLWIFFAYTVTYSAYTLAMYGDWHQLEWQTYICFFANAALALFTYGLIYVCEKLFGLTSTITLVELANVNSQLMLEFAEKAPGTFQHSLQVSNLATEAAKSIGANSLLVRVGALYHDIGKMVNPQLFTENQTDGNNPLNDLPYDEAAQLIIAHVEEGVKLAKKHKLPQTIIHFIETHHGDSRVRYFYNKYVNENPDMQVDESLFSYPGPRPDTKEAAILMMADAVEARSRSLKTVTEESVRKMVEEMVGMQINEQQLKNTSLSFNDVEIIKNTFVERLTTMYHHRITYPKLKKKR